MSTVFVKRIYLFKADFNDTQLFPPCMIEYIYQGIVSLSVIYQGIASLSVIYQGIASLSAVCHRMQP